MQIWLLPQLCSPNTCCLKFSGLFLLQQSGVLGRHFTLVHNCWSVRINGPFLFSPSASAPLFSPLSSPSWSLPSTPSLVTQTPPLSTPPIIGCHQFYLTSSLKLSSKGYRIKTGVYKDLLVLEQPDPGVQNLAIEYKHYQTCSVSGTHDVFSFSECVCKF